MNNNDLSSMHESDIRKNFSNLDTLISNIKFSEESIKNNLISQAEKLLKDTEMKIKNYQISTEYSESSKIKDFQKKLLSYKKKINSVSKENTNNKSLNNNYYNRDDDTQNLTSNSFNKIQLATRNTIEMESMTGDILGDLNNQSEKMKGVKSKLGVMDTDLNSSNSLLGNIIEKQSDDMKVIIIVGCILSLITFCFLMYKIIRLFL